MTVKWEWYDLTGYVDEGMGYNGNEYGFVVELSPNQSKDLAISESELRTMLAAVEEFKQEHGR